MKRVWEKERKRGKCHEIKDFLGYITVKLSFPIYPLLLPFSISCFTTSIPAPVDFHTEYLFTVKYIFCFGCYCLVSLMFIALFGWLCWIFVPSKVKNSIPLTNAPYICISHARSNVFLSAVDKIYIVQMRWEKRKKKEEKRSVYGKQREIQSSKLAKLSGKRNL